MGELMVPCFSQLDQQEGKNKQPCPGFKLTDSISFNNNSYTKGPFILDFKQMRLEFSKFCLTRYEFDAVYNNFSYYVVTHLSNVQVYYCLTSMILKELILSA